MSQEKERVGGEVPIAAIRVRRSSDELARETLDAIRLAVAGAANDRAAMMVIRTLLADGPAPDTKSTGSVARLVRAIKRTRRLRLAVRSV